MTTLSRRRFLKTSAQAGGGLIVAMHLPGCAFGGALPIDVADDGFVPNAFLQITQNNEIIFYCPSDEMGQGIRTGLATVIGEELDVHPASMTVMSAGSHEDYNNPEYAMQLTGGSNAVRAFYLPLRQIGADTRALILQAAAQDLGIPPSQLKTRNATVIAGDRHYPYGDFLVTASSLPLPENTALKNSRDFQFIGQEMTRVDAREKTTGEAIFGLDIDVPDQVAAVVVRPPVAGASVTSFDPAAALASSGVLQVVEISSGIAVVADSYWQANRAAQRLQVTWDNPALSAVSSDSMRADLAAALRDGNDAVTEDAGDIDSALAAGAPPSGAVIHSAEYFAPLLAHAPMEPVNATLRLRNGEADLWTGVQAIGAAQGLIERITGYPRENIRVHNQYLGGGFGRRASLTHIIEVTEIALAVNKPVQLVWSREDDLKHGLYRPASLMQLSAAVDGTGRISGWRAKRAGGNLTPDYMRNSLPALMPNLPEFVLEGLTAATDYWLSRWSIDGSSVEGLHETYDLPTRQISHVTVDHGLPLTFWRSVGHSYTGFAVESMMDELAEAADIDPIEFRLKQLESKPRMYGVVAKAGELMNAMSVPEGHFLGFAAHSSFATDVAQIAEVSVTDNKIKVHRVTCVVNCGTAVNPDIIRAQLEGSVMFALTATLHGKIDLAEGAIVQSNFHDYPILRMDEAPEVDVFIMPSDEKPTGIGEPGVPPLAPAVANAVYRASGQRLRELPLRLA